MDLHPKKNSQSDAPQMPAPQMPAPRKNPMVWDDVEEAQGVLSPTEGMDSLDLGGVSSSDNPLALLGEPGAGRRDRSIRSDALATPAVREVFERIEAALDKAAETGGAWRYRVDHLSEEERGVLFDALGEGEVSLVITGGAPGEGDAQIQETILPGVWIGRAVDEDDLPAAHWVEVGDCPRALREVAARRPRPDLAVEALTAPRGAMNVMSVLSEVRDRSLNWVEGEPNHVFNFTLFPMTPADSAYLAQTLGEAGVRITSGGYGSARVVLTGVRLVWAVQYLNGLGSVILDTLEVGDVPDAVLASQDDMADSAVRLRDIQEAYAE